MRYLLALFGVFSLIGASSASAADQLWWSNRNDPEVARVVRSAMDGTGAVNVIPSSVGGRVNTAVADPARGKLYWTERASDKLWVSDLDGSNAAILLQGPGDGIDPSGTTYSLSIDPVNQKLYWTTNVDWSIRWATTDGTQFGTLYTQGDASVAGALFAPNQILIDQPHNRIWWANYDIGSSGVNPSYGYANLDGTGDSHAIDMSCFSTTGGPTIDPDDASGIAVDYAAGKIYGQVELAFDASGHFMAESNLDGSDCKQISAPYTPGQPNSKGLALDPDTSWLYNARGKSGTPPLTDPLMEYMDLKLAPVSVLSNLPISPREFVNAARFPFIIKPPKLATGSVSVSASGTEPGATLTLTGAETIDDQITMRVYRGAATQSIKWYRDGEEIPGETGRTVIATERGVYKAVYTAGNFAGNTESTSNEVTVAVKPSPGPTPGPTPSNSFTAVSAAPPSGAIVTVGRLPGAGKVGQAAARRANGRWVKVCSSVKVTKTVGRFRLSCEPNAATRKAQKNGRVRVRVRVTYTPSGGSPRTVTRFVWLRSLKPHFTG